MKVVIGIVSVLAGWLLANAVVIALEVSGLNVPTRLATDYSQRGSYLGAEVLILTIGFGWLIYRVIGRYRTGDRGGTPSSVGTADTATASAGPAAGADAAGSGRRDPMTSPMSTVTAARSQMATSTSTEAPKLATAATTQPLTCPECGRENRPGSRICRGCHLEFEGVSSPAPLPEAVPAPVETTTPAQPDPVPPAQFGRWSVAQSSVGELAGREVTLATDAGDLVIVAMGVRLPVPLASLEVRPWLSGLHVSADDGFSLRVIPLDGQNGGETAAALVSGVGAHAVPPGDASSAGASAHVSPTPPARPAVRRSGAAAVIGPAALLIGLLAVLFYGPDVMYVVQGGDGWVSRGTEACLVKEWNTWNGRHMQEGEFTQELWQQVKAEPNVNATFLFMLNRCF